MIDLSRIVETYGDRCLFAEPGGGVSYAEFASMVARKSGEIEKSGDSPETIQPLSLTWSAVAFATLIARFQLGQTVFPGDSIPCQGLESFKGFGPLLILKTGGTTGDPRHVVHSVGKLLAPYRLEERPESRLLVLYAADHIAGIDAFLQALHRGGTLVIPADTTPATLADCLEKQAVQVLPATPTFLQFLILSGELEGRDLSKVTAIPHGAEPMPSSLRERVSSIFPNARLLQRFGMTELGALPVRPDPEFPEAMFLEAPGYAWKVEAGELLIKSPVRMLGTLEEGPVKEGAWHHTGDLAEQTTSGSIRVLGRREALINIGGEKVIPETVEAMILQQENVLDAAVFGQPNPLTGQALCAQVVFRIDPDPMRLMRSLRAASRDAGLSLAHVPTRIEAVEQLDKTAIGKRARPRGKA